MAEEASHFVNEYLPSTANTQRKPCGRTHSCPNFRRIRHTAFFENRTKPAEDTSKDVCAAATHAFQPRVRLARPSFAKKQRKHTIHPQGLSKTTSRTQSITRLLVVKRRTRKGTKEPPVTVSAHVGLPIQASNPLRLLSRTLETAHSGGTWRELGIPVDATYEWFHAVQEAATCRDPAPTLACVLWITQHMSSVAGRVDADASTACTLRPQCETIHNAIRDVMLSRGAEQRPPFPEGNGSLRAGCRPPNACGGCIGPPTRPGTWHTAPFRCR